MARKRKKKISRTQVQGLFRVKVYHGTNREDYLARVYEMNRQLFESAYEEAKQTARREVDPRAITRFKKAYPNIKIWIKKTVENTIRTSDKNINFGKGVLEAIRLNFTSPIMRFKQNILSGMKSFGIYEDFMFAINEEFNIDKLHYADGNYVYDAEGGRRVIIEVRNSPYTMDITVSGEKING